MYAQVEKPKENKSQSVANETSQKQSDGESTFQFVDNRPEAIAQRKLQEMANNRSQVSHLGAFFPAPQEKFATNEGGLKSLSVSQRVPLNIVSATSALPIQRVLNINHQARDSNYVGSLDEYDFNIGDNDWGQITSVLTSWIPLEEDKNAGSDAVAVAQAIDAIGGYNEFYNEETDIGQEDPMYLNHDVQTVYTGAGFSVNECIALYNLMGRARFEEVADSGVAMLRTIYTAHGIAMVESLSTLTANTLASSLDNINNLSALLDVLGSDKILALINAVGIGNEEINRLFANMTPAHANLLDQATLLYVAARTALQIAGLEAQWEFLRPNGWLASAATVASTLALVTGGYTFAECARLAAAYRLSAADAVILQIAMLDFATLDLFIPKGRSYGLSTANLITVAQANVNAAFLVLQAALRPQSLNLINKDDRFSSWITAVNALMTNDLYTINVGGSVELDGDGETWERIVTVHSPAPAQVGRFVIHYHPNATGANIYSPDASRRHIKPWRGNRFTQRVLWAGIPGTLQGQLPGGHN